jgi:hypothetical protein
MLFSIRKIKRVDLDLGQFAKEIFCSLWLTNDWASVGDILQFMLEL